MKIDGMITDTKIGYLNYYIPKKFHSYCSFIASIEFYNIINVMKEDKFIKSCSLERMKNGEYDEYIDSLFIGYIEQIVSSRVVNYNEFLKYVTVLISQQNPELGEDFFNDLSRKFALNIITERNDITDPTMFAIYGKRLLDDYDKVIDGYRDFAREWIAEIVEKNNNQLPEDVQEDFVDAVLDRCSVKSIVNGLNQSEVLPIYKSIFWDEVHRKDSKVRRIYENNACEIIERIVIINGFGLHKDAIEYFVDAIFDDYDINDIIAGLNRNDVLDRYRQKYKEVVDKIEKVVSEVYANTTPMPVYLKKEDLIEDVKKMTLNTGKYKIIDVITGANNSIISLYCSMSEKQPKNITNEPIISERDVGEYIIRKINSYVSGKIIKLSDDDIKDILNDVVIQMEKRNVIPSDVMKCRYDDLISEICDKHSRKLNSMRGSKKKHNTRKRRMTKNITALVLAATVLGAAGSIAVLGNAVVNGAKDMVEDIKYNAAVNHFEEYGVAFPALISTTNSSEFNQSVDSVIDFYLLCKEKGLDDSKYFALGFNLVRERVSSSKTLVVMDSLLSRVKAKAKKLEGAYDLIEAVEDSCFLEFIYEELYNMGCEEIKDDKYLNVISEYNVGITKADTKNNETPWDYLSDKNKLLAERMVDLYLSYSKKFVIEANNLIGDDKDADSFIALLASAYDFDSGRGR